MHTTDVAIIGAGPAGLFQVFELGLLGLSAQVIDALPRAGGQCIELYPDKPLYDIPGIPLCTGEELTERLLKQMAPWPTPLHLGHAVEQFQRDAEGRFTLTTEAGLQLRSRAVVIAAGAGAFTPRRITVDGLRAFEGTQVFHHPEPAARFHGRDVLIAGDDDLALSWALRLCAGQADGHPVKARRVRLLHRRDRWRADPALVAQVHGLHQAGQLQLVFGQVTGIETDGNRLAALKLLDMQGLDQREPVDLLLPLLGLSPRLGPLADWGLDLQQKLVPVDPATLRTHQPGVYAIGDIITYPGKRKLILCAFHEATLAAFDIAQRLGGGEPVQTQYTTSSSLLQQRLGVPKPAL